MSPSKPVHKGQFLITEFDPTEMDSIEEEVSEFLDLDEGDELQVRIPGGDRLEVYVIESQDE